MSDWISVKDHLPENNQDVLVYEDQHIYMVTYSRIETKYKPGYVDIWDIDYGNECDPSFWMPLPKPPEEI